MNTKGLLLDIKRFAVHDGPGIRTTFFLKGCPLKCRWCHNPEGILSRAQLAYYSHKCLDCGECLAACPRGAHSLAGGRHFFQREKCTACGACEQVCLGVAIKHYGKHVTVEQALVAAVEDLAFFEKSGGGVTLSGGEPLVQPEFCREFLGALKREGIHTAVDTCGLVGWQAFEKVLPVTDMFLFDIKHGISAEHEKLAGHGNEEILENLQRLSSLGVRIEIRFPLVPGCNDSQENFRALGVLFVKMNIEGVKILPYHSMARSKYAALGLEDTMPLVNSPTAQELQHAGDALKSFGVRVFRGLD